MWKEKIKHKKEKKVSLGGNLGLKKMCSEEIFRVQTFSAPLLKSNYTIGSKRLKWQI